MLGIDQQQFELVFQNVSHRFPKHTGRFHNYVGNSLRCQPIPQSQDFTRHCSKTTCLLMYPTLWVNSSNTCLDRFLMNVQSSANRENGFHYTLLIIGVTEPNPALGNIDVCYSLLYVLEAQSWVRGDVRVTLIGGLQCAKQTTTSTQGRARHQDIALRPYFHRLRVPRHAP